MTKFQVKALVACCVGSGFLLAAASGVHGQEPEAMKVRVARAAEREVPVTIRLVGTVRPELRSVLGSEIAGLVSRIDVRAGDDVKEGQILCELKTDTLEIEKLETLAELDRLKARLAELEHGTRPAELARLKAAVAEAEAIYDMWTFEKSRLSRLYEDRSGSEKEFRDATAQSVAAAQRLAQATAEYQLGEEGARQEVIAQARFALKAQEAVVARIDNDLRRSKIRAPYDASIIKRFMEVGEWVQVGGPVVEVVSLSQVLVVVHVPESAIAFTKVGDPVQVYVDALAKTYDGRVLHVIAEAEEDARTFPVELVITNDQGQLKSGMFVRATVRAGPRQKFVVVPKDAVVQRDGTYYVCVVEPGRSGPMAFPTPVRLGAEDGEWVAIVEGDVAVGTQVVTYGNERLVFPESGHR